MISTKNPSPQNIKEAQQRLRKLQKKVSKLQKDTKFLSYLMEKVDIDDPSKRNFLWSVKASMLVSLYKRVSKDLDSVRVELYLKNDIRGGSGNSDTRDKWSFCLRAA